MTTTRPLSNILSGVVGGLIVLVIGAILIATNVIDTGDTKTVVRQVTTTQPTGDTSGSAGRTVRQIYDQEGKGVAFITANGVTSDSTSPFGLPQQGTATGSGFVIDKDGYIVTNAHVVEGANSVTVSFTENGESVPAEVKGVDRSTDVAVLKVDPSKFNDLTTIPLGDSSKAQVGDPVIAIGNPFGLSRTVTTGIVSGLQRQIQAPNGFTISNVIQTDAAINPGNSGGPLLDANGRVIGINSQIQTGGGQGSVGIGFAVPINTVKDELSKLKAGESVDRAYLGVQMQRVDGQLAQDLNLPADHGALIVSVTPDSPAAKAGLRGGRTGTSQGVTAGGDLIVAIDGKDMKNEDAVANAIAGTSPATRCRSPTTAGTTRRPPRSRSRSGRPTPTRSGSGSGGGGTTP